MSLAARIISGAAAAFGLAALMTLLFLLPVGERVGPRAGPLPTRSSSSHSPGSSGTPSPAASWFPANAVDEWDILGGVEIEHTIEYNLLLGIMLTLVVIVVVGMVVALCWMCVYRVTAFSSPDEPSSDDSSPDDPSSDDSSPDDPSPDDP